MSSSLICELELDLREKLSFKSNLEYKIKEINSFDDEDEEKQPKTCVSLKTDSFSGYVPCFQTMTSNLEEGKEICLKKAICFIEMVQEMKYGIEELEEKISSNFSKLYSKKLQLLQKPNNSPHSENSNAFCNWIGKQRARFRIRKTEKSEIKAHLIPIGGSGGSSKQTFDVGFPNRNEKTHFNDSSIQNGQSCTEEPADVKILSICEELSLPIPNFTYQECQLTNEMRCSLEFLGQVFTASQIGGKRIQIKERVCQIALETLKHKLQEMHYQKKQVEMLSNSNSLSSSSSCTQSLQLDASQQPKNFSLQASSVSFAMDGEFKKQDSSSSTTYTSNSDFVPVKVGKLVEIDVNRINNPLLELESHAQIDEDNIPANILSMLSAFSKRKKLKCPEYTIKSIGFCFSGSATFAGHHFDLDGKTFSSKKEVKFQLAFLIWKSLKSVSCEIDLDGSVAASAPSPKERHQKFVNRFGVAGSKEPKYSLSPEINSNSCVSSSSSSSSSSSFSTKYTSPNLSNYAPELTIPRKQEPIYSNYIPQIPLSNGLYPVPFAPPVQMPYFHPSHYAFNPTVSFSQTKRNFSNRMGETCYFSHNSKRSKAESNRTGFKNRSTFAIKDAFPSLKHSPKKRPNPFDKRIPQITTHPILLMNSEQQAAIETSNSFPIPNSPVKNTNQHQHQNLPSSAIAFSQDHLSFHHNHHPNDTINGLPIVNQCTKSNFTSQKDSNYACENFQKNSQLSSSASACSSKPPAFIKPRLAPKK